MAAVLHRLTMQLRLPVQPRPDRFHERFHQAVRRSERVGDELPRWPLRRRRQLRSLDLAVRVLVQGIGHLALGYQLM